MASWRTWNWWKIAFFATLFLLEVTREFFVMQSSQPPNLAAIKTITRFGDLIHAEGKWVRNDNGDRLVPLLVTIDCNRAETHCIEASTRILPGGYVVTPTVEIYPARFADGVVEYQNTGLCTNYTTRIDAVAEEAYQTRTRTSNRGATCNTYASKLSARLGNGWDDVKDPLDGHFLPVVALLKGIYALLS